MNTDNIKPELVLPNLYYIKHSDPGAVKAGLATNTFILINNGKALIMDASSDYLFDPIKEVIGAELEVAGFIYSHSHVVANGNYISAFKQEFNAPFFLHPTDQAYFRGFEFLNPVNHPVINDFNIEIIHFPGHTPGHIMLYNPANAGLLLAGDAAMGPTDEQTQNGMERLIRVPARLSYDDELIRQNWLAFDKPVSHVAPYHGTIYINKQETLPQIMKPLTRVEITHGLMG